jgi:hypothetical protein
LSRFVFIAFAGLALSGCQAPNHSMTLAPKVSAPGRNLCGPNDFSITEGGQIRCHAKKSGVAQ